MIVKKEMYDKELQAQYNQFRFIISMNSKKWGLRLMNGLVRLTKGQKVKEVVNETHFVPSNSTKNHKIRTRVYRPKGITKPLPAMIYFHGGGYMMGIPEMANPFYEDVLKRKDIVIVSPDYRLSQKDPFPAGFNDCYDTLLWLRDQAKELNVDPNNIIIAGHSAGGGIISKFERLLKNYYNSTKVDQMGIPSVEYCAKQLNVSPNYLTDLLKKETGKTSLEHIHLFLIEKAKNSLLNSSNTISEIGYSLGFEYPQHFSNLFKSKTGVSPKAYRNLN